MMVAGERSIAIRTLEEELGTPLFVRTTCRVEPTQAGQLFAEFAQSTRKGYEAFQAALAAGQRQRESWCCRCPPPWPHATRSITTCCWR
ncbi:LysR family transcriptional regulator [Faecalibacterium taiwanense]|uniref:LysR family transcriptional regulator n=1 Tax=Faecalibacterium taiwanense TaxID=3030638 RepID=UPI0031FEF923